MQANNSPRFLKNFMIGLVASSAGAFIALPGSAMPEPTETGTEIEAIEAVETLDTVEAVPSPDADEAIPAEGATVLETEPVAADESMEMEMDPVADETEISEEEPIAEEGMEAEEPVAAEESMDGEPVVEDVEAMEEPIADETEMVEGEPVADDAEAMEEPVADDMEATEDEPVAGDVDTADFTIAELTDNSESFEILAAALAAADLTEILGGEGPFTVFAPTDDAFAALPEGAVDQLLMPENKDVLVQVLTYHVVPGALLSTELETGSVATVEGSEVALDVSDTVTVNNANVVVADVEASNGVIHIIDRVIIPPSPEADAEVDAEETATTVQ
ncbi:MAG: fasciclin domain-containing protein [Cyanobacteria bacterium J06621_11]